MRYAMLSLIICLTAPCLQADEKQISTRKVDKQLVDVLKDVHNRGADLFNAGDTASCYRLFQGCLQTTRAMLAHRPDEQKYIDDIQADAELQPALALKAFSLHQSIEKLRLRLRPVIAELKTDKEPEIIPLPRETRPVLPEPPKVVPPPKDGVNGKILWQAKPLNGVQVTFVWTVPFEGVANALKLTPEYKGVSMEDGTYSITKVPPGKYKVLLTMPKGRAPQLPERYAAVETTPLLVDVKGGGDTLDLLLQ